MLHALKEINKSFGLNRNILECKFYYTSLLLNIIAVLIETYWNVNAVVPPHISGKTNVLIETYWNVN